MNKNQNQPLSLNDRELVRNRDLQSITSVTLNELNDVTGGGYIFPLPSFLFDPDFRPPIRIRHSAYNLLRSLSLIARDDQGFRKHNPNGKRTLPGVYPAIIIHRCFAEDAGEGILTQR